MLKLKRVLIAGACAVAAATPAFAVVTVPTDVQTGLDTFSLTHSAVTAIAVGVLATWMGFRFVRKIG